jgi:hypothetical protein
LFGGDDVKKLLFPILMVLTATIGCLIAPPVPNQPPTAYIDSVSPVNATLGETVTFNGHGIDSDGSIAAYNWRSSLDGDLSTSASFKTQSLSQGTHTIWFKVQDEKGDWSKDVSTNVIIVPEGIGQPVVESFDASPGTIVPGGSSTLSWGVSGAETVSIGPDIGNVALSGTRVVSPTKTKTYTLTATSAVGTATATAQVVVAETLPNKVELYSIIAEDGQIRKDDFIGQEPDVGNTKTSSATQAFLSFDISTIPKDAVIKSATLDLTTATIHGAPFNILGMLFVYDCQYETLSFRDYVVDLRLGALYSIALPPSQPITSQTLASAVQKRVDAGSSRFQLRFQFQKSPCCHRNAEYVELGEGKTRLIIEYED